jgi:hypothetical protein
MRAVSWLLVLGAVAAPCPHSAARVSARSLLQSWNPQGWHSNGYDDRRIECEAAARLPLAQLVHASAASGQLSRSNSSLAGRREGPEVVRPRKP